MDTYKKAFLARVANIPRSEIENVRVVHDMSMKEAIGGEVIRLVNEMNMFLWSYLYAPTCTICDKICYETPDTEHAFQYKMCVECGNRISGVEYEELEEVLIDEY